jgi:SAM-dependent methyltransferase
MRSESDDAPPAPDRIRAIEAAVGPAFALLAGMQLGLFTALGGETLTAETLAARLGLPAPRLRRLLDALVVAGLLLAEGDAYTNGAEARHFLDETKPGSIAGEHALLAMLWRADLMTAESIRTGRPAALHDYRSDDVAGATAFFGSLAAGALAFGAELARERLDGVATILDVGGGAGHTALGMLRARPALRPTVLELGPTLDVARAMLAAEPDAAAIRLQPDDITVAAPAGRFDALLMKAFLQCLGPDEARRAVGHAYACLRPGGRIFIAGAGILDDGGRSPAGAVFFDLTFMNIYPAGASHRRRDYVDWLEAAGFGEVDISALPSGTLVISARRPLAPTA